MFKYITAFHDNTKDKGESNVSPKEHCPECKSMQNKADTLIKIYDKAWPEYCIKCNGTGGWESTDSKEGIIFNVCTNCLGKGRCPRCNVQVFSSAEAYASYLVCPVCAWSEYEPMSRPDREACLCEDI